MIPHHSGSDGDPRIYTGYLQDRVAVIYSTTLAQQTVVVRSVFVATIGLCVADLVQKYFYSRVVGDDGNIVLYPV